ncbi:hypothetical protein PoB_006625500 [Plakobranchus ocellatus]|uniref:Uncharacterized protein n=1 Tax=Plakobranchus ocellatus TaxID=259542 RepID=A0AAV4D6Y4_9GAST|nr:hypothetical protein PoB_006625500 [Plakobranchus ocellatus]
MKYDGVVSLDTTSALEAETAMLFLDLTSHWLLRDTRFLFPIIFTPSAVGRILSRRSHQSHYHQRTRKLGKKVGKAKSRTVI